MLRMGVTPEINALCTVLLGAVFLLVAFSRLFQKSSRSRFFEKKLGKKL